MKLCKECNKKVEGMYSIYCIDCKVIKRRITSKACREKYQYNKQPKFRYATYKRGAVRRKLEFDLTLEEFSSFWNTNCSYCNDPIEGIGLDRKDNNKGYTKDNIVACCTVCNWMKHKMTHDKFIEQCNKISKCFTTGTL